jgi:hypothetical protein
MNIKEGAMLTLNPAGSIIWRLLTDGRTPVQIAAHLVAEFGISHERACTDVNEFLETLRAQQLIETDESFDPRLPLRLKPVGLFCNLFGKREAHGAQRPGSK